MLQRVYCSARVQHGLELGVKLMAGVVVRARIGVMDIDGGKATARAFA